jgi:hypothetical protein
MLLALWLTPTRTMVMKFMARLILKVMSTMAQTTMKIIFVIAVCIQPHSFLALSHVPLKIDLCHRAVIKTAFRRW